MNVDAINYCDSVMPEIQSIIQFNLHNSNKPRVDTETETESGIV